MADDRYNDIGAPIDRLIEEIGEVLQAWGKIQRFGMFNSDPEAEDDPNTNNMRDFINELNDLKNATAETYLWALKKAMKHHKEEGKNDYQEQR